MNKKKEEELDQDFYENKINVNSTDYFQFQMTETLVLNQHFSCVIPF